MVRGCRCGLAISTLRTLLNALLSVAGEAEKTAARLQADPSSDALSRALNDYRRVFTEEAMEFLEGSE